MKPSKNLSLIANSFLIMVSIFLLKGTLAFGQTYKWGNAIYVNLSIGEQYSYMGKTVCLVSSKNQACVVEVDGKRKELLVARRCLPEVIDGVRVFVADNRHVAELTTTEKNQNVHAALTKDALLCLSDPSKPLLDPSKYVFPIDRIDGFEWNMGENSHMFAYLRPVRAHEGIDIDLSDARGRDLHALLAPENGIVRAILNKSGSKIENRLFIQSEKNPELSYSYSHINRNRVLVDVGQKVKKGQQIAYIWGDWRWGHLHFSLRNYNFESVTPGYDGFKYLLNTFPQMYELWYGDLKPHPRTHLNDSFRFAGQYWTRGNCQYLDQYSDLLGYGWRLGPWCTTGRVETSRVDEGVKPGQSARLKKTMHTVTPHPAQNPKDYFDFEINVSNGRYFVQAEVGDMYDPTWQKVEIEGRDTGIYELDKTLDWTPIINVPVQDGKLTIRIHLRDSSTPAGIRELHFTRTTTGR